MPKKMKTMRDGGDAQTANGRAPKRQRSERRQKLPPTVCVTMKHCQWKYQWQYQWQCQWH